MVVRGKPRIQEKYVNHMLNYVRSSGVAAYAQIARIGAETFKEKIEPKSVTFG
jgi:hypothetical protein